MKQAPAQKNRDTQSTLLAIRRQAVRLALRARGHVAGLGVGLRGLRCFAPERHVPVQGARLPVTCGALSEGPETEPLAGRGQAPGAVTVSVNEQRPPLTV